MRASNSHRRPALARAAAVVAVLAGSVAAAPSAWAAPTDLYVSPSGSDTNAGSSAQAPLKTIQAALDVATPGVTVHLAAGTYHERPVTKRAGTASSPIVIEGPETGKDRAGRYKATLYGTSRVFSINHSYYTLEGFTIDGQEQLAGVRWPTSVAATRAFKDSVQSKVADGRLLYIGADDATRNLTGIKVHDMFLNGAGGECLRMRNNATRNTVTDNVIQFCGLYGKGDDVQRDKYHNGEGVYIGTSPGSTTQPMYANDTSSGNVVSGNVIHTFGSECVDIKENAHDNVVQGNDCGFNAEPLKWKGSAVELRGDHNTVQANMVTDSAGMGIKLWSDSAAYDRGGNAVVGNRFTNIAGAVFSITQRSPGLLCGNTLSAGTPLRGSTLSTLTAGCPAGSPTATAPTSTAPTSTAPAPTAPAPTAPAPTAPAPTAPAPTAPAPVASRIVLEAEAGAVKAPMTVATDPAASGGKYVVQTATQGPGAVTYSFTVPTTGSYRLSGRVSAANGSSNSFLVSVDGSSAKAWNLPVTTSWVWASGQASTLTRGTHTVVVQRRESGAKLDSIALERVA